MKWTRFRLKIREDAEDIVACALADAGIQGVEIEDKAPLTDREKQQMFVDIPPEAEEDDGAAYLSFYLDPETEDIPAVLANVRGELDALRPFCDIGEAVIEQEEMEDIDWASEWKKYFRPFRIDDIHVVPSWWEEQPEGPEAGSAALVLRMDPGTAFGTGMHETTQLCIRQMRKYLKDGSRVLDIGTGSGILGILALKFGAGSVLGTDLDPCAEGAVGDNCGANDVEYAGRISAGGKDAAPSAAEIPAGCFALTLGNLIDDPAVQALAGEDRYDIVFSNILADVLTALAPAAARAAAPGGLWITSGILEGKERMVAEAGEAAGLVLEEITQQGEWMSVTMRKPRRPERQ